MYIEHTILEYKEHVIGVGRGPLHEQDLLRAKCVNHVEAFLEHVPHLERVIHEKTGDEVPRHQTQLDVGHADLAEGKDLLQTAAVVQVVEVHVRVTCERKPSAIRRHSLPTQET